jgi:hypothetical protein
VAPDATSRTRSAFRLGGAFVLAMTLSACAKAEEPYEGPMPQVKEFFLPHSKATFDVVERQKSTSSICYSGKVTGTTSSGAPFVSVMTRPPGERQYQPIYDQAGANDALVRRRDSGAESVVLRAPLKAGAPAWKSPSDFTPLDGRETAEMSCRVTRVTLQRPLKSDWDLPVVTVKCEAVSRGIRYTRTESFAQHIGTVSSVYTESRPDGSQEKTLVTERISDFEPRVWKNESSKVPLECN